MSEVHDSCSSDNQVSRVDRFCCQRCSGLRFAGRSKHWAVTHCKYVFWRSLGGNATAPHISTKSKADEQQYYTTLAWRRGRACDGLGLLVKPQH